MFTHGQKRLGIAAVAALSFLACSDASGPLAPFEPQITNAADDFQFQATNVSKVTWTYTYQWLNTGDSATVNQATTVTGGSATLTISDSTGPQLYS
jgi:hypothetical protein